MLDDVDIGFAALIGQVFAEDTAERHDATAARILDAAIGEIAARGLANVTVDGVAKRAKVNRVTVYRRFGGREQLLQTLAAREGRRAILTMADAALPNDDPEERFARAFVAIVRFCREHPIVQRVARMEPDELISAGHAEGALLLRMGAGFVAEAIRDAQTQGRATHVDADEAAETVALLMCSFILLPTSTIDLDDDQAAERYARRTLLPMLLGAKV